MQESFWQERWAAGQTGFHEEAPNAFLTRHFAALALEARSHVFVPLCGKSVDLDWLLAQGHRVTGIEFSRSAVDAVFERMNMVPDVTEVRGLTRLRGEGITLWQGDFFALNVGDLDHVDAVYDRAALVALPAETRPEYAAHLRRITANAPQILIAFDYDQTQTDGPPFSVPEPEIQARYAASHQIRALENAPIQGRLAQRCSGFERTWLLTPKAL